MKAFVNGLEKSPTLEDAVDVADSYASINDKSIHDLILNQVQYSLKQAKQTGNKRAADIYKILNTLFLSIDSLITLMLLNPGYSACILYAESI